MILYDTVTNWSQSHNTVIVESYMIICYNKKQGKVLEEIMLYNIFNIY